MNRFPKPWIPLALFCFAIAFGSLSVSQAHAAAPAARKILFLGDSITYGGLYVEYFETFLRLQYPTWEGQVLNLGLPSETVSGLSEEGHAGGAFPRPNLFERLDRVLGQTKPDLVIACYGINDGIYLPFSEDRFRAFQQGIERLRAKVTAIKAQLVLLTPPTYDAAAAGQNQNGPSYNQVMDRYSEWLLSKRAEGWVVLDIHGPMNRFLADHRQQNPGYRLADDGVHPNGIGHWLIARPLVAYYGDPDRLATADSISPLLEMYPFGPEVLQLVAERQRLLKDAWLTQTGHRRPGMAKGLPMAEATRQTARLEPQIRELAGPPPVPDIRRDAKGRVTLLSASTNAIVRFTLDGSEPTRDSGAYLAPIEFPFEGTVKAAAFGPASPAHGPVASVKFEPIAGSPPRPPSTLLPVTQNRDWRSYDWPTRHAAVCRMVAERKPGLVFIGDSITHFFGGDPAASIARGKSVWEKYYARRNALNLGFGWDRTENVLWRLNHGELNGASPKVAVLLLGTNNLDVDSPDQIADGLREVCRVLHTNSPSTKILLLGILPRSQKPDERRARLAQVNARIAAFHGADGICYLDVGQRFLGEDGSIASELMDDFLHPTEKGYALFAAAIEPTLANLLGEQPITQ